MSIESIKRWFEAAVANPVDENFQIQLGCHLEEVAEMLDCLTWRKGREANYFLADKAGLVADRLKTKASTAGLIDRQGMLDALCDQIVTAIGVAHMLGFDISRALAEVDRANWSKFVDGSPVFDNNGKIKKGPGYIPPNLDGMA